MDIIYLNVSKAFDKVDHAKSLTGTQVTGDSSGVHFPRTAGYFQGNTRVPTRANTVPAVC